MKNILLIYTGGTFGMVPVEPTKTLVPTTIQNHILGILPEIKKIANIELQVPFNLDSSNIQIYHWQELASLISQNYQDFDGFVIVHGTDTMIYTATALSFMLRNLSKPIILTGSQRPLAEIRSDARGNLINSLELATHPIPEVCIFFGTYLFRGNRTVKISNTHYNAFASPNFSPLAEVGLDITLSPNALLPGQELRFDPQLKESVICFRFFPGLLSSNLQYLVNSPIQAVIIEAVGSGNLASKENSMIPWIKEMTERGKIVAINSQSIYGKVNMLLYESGLFAQKAGALSSGDMTTPATVVKLMHLIGKHGDNTDRIKKEFVKSLAGELTPIKK
jgi:L-asparaginase